MKENNSKKIGYKARKILPSADYLNERFEYNAETGVLIHKPTGSVGEDARFAGKVAGCVTSNGYRVLSLEGVAYLAHRIIYKMVHGIEPPEFLDHINNNRDDNRIANIREVSHSQNRRNSLLNKNNTTGYKGVSFVKGKYRALIWIDGINKNLGRYDTAEAAHEAYQIAASEYYGDYANFG